jgi:hypothetical protein
MPDLYRKYSFEILVSALHFIFILCAFVIIDLLFDSLTFSCYSVNKKCCDLLMRQFVRHGYRVP